MIEELAWDTAFFGRKIGRIRSPFSSAEIRRTIKRAREEKFKYLTCRLAASGISAIQMLERAGFYLTDFGLVFERDLKGLDRPQQTARAGTAEDAVTIGRLVKGQFRAGRFFHDPFFSAGEAESMYRTWAENLLKGAADKVFLIEEKGFVACKVSEDGGEIPLIGVSADHQGRGTGTALMLSALAWFKEKDVASVKVRTQAGNSGAMVFYQRLEFGISSADVTMGKMLVY